MVRDGKPFCHALGGRSTQSILLSVYLEKKNPCSTFNRVIKRGIFDFFFFLKVQHSEGNLLSV